MSVISVRNFFSKLMVVAFTALALTGCVGQDKPFSLVGDSNKPPPDGGPTPPGDPGGGMEGCFVNFNGEIQLKISAHPTGGTPIEKLDARPVALEPLPIKADGNNLTIFGDQFPTFVLTTVNEQVDLRISGIPGTSASGTYDPATGAIEINDFQFNLEILDKGTDEPFVEGKEVLKNIDFTTDSVTINGNNNPITEDGVPVNSSDKSVTLVVGFTLPEKFSVLNLLDTRIGGGALTARFEGALDQLPDQCTGGAPGGGGTPGGGGPAEFSVSDGSTSKLTSLDFGSTPVVVTSVNDKTVLDCKDALNRGILTKTLTITNTGEGERKFQFIRAQDTDGDAKDPLCSGNAEFVRGAISVSGGASCETVTVGGRSFAVDQCTLPAGTPDAKIAFPMMYAPFNFVAAAEEGQPPLEDTGALQIGYDDGKSFSISLKGKSEPDTRDVFSLSKVKDGVVQPKQIKNKGLVKIPLQNGDPKPFTQRIALLNGGPESWQDIQITVNSVEGTPVFSATGLSATAIGPADGENPGKVEFDLVFAPGSASAYNETLTLTMVKAGTSDATTLTYTLSGTVGVPTLSGAVKFQIDFLTAKIDHTITVGPIESLDFRAHPDQAPPPLPLTFADTDVEGIKAATMNTENRDVTTLSSAERRQTIRLLNAQATMGLAGTKLVPGDGADKCNEPASITVPYNDSRRECAYFYYSIFGDIPGIYDDDSGELTLPSITLRIQNPYHSDIVGKWPKSNYGGPEPNYVMDAEVIVTLTTRMIDQLTLQENGEEVPLVPNPRISTSDLSVRSKPLGEECPEDYLNHDPSQGTLEEKHPRFKCYLSTGERYVQGLPANLRPESTTEYDLVLVGIGRFESLALDPNLPWFMGENGGSRMYLAIQGRLFKE
jgi:hypothetical protein